MEVKNVAMEMAEVHIEVKAVELEQGGTVAAIYLQVHHHSFQVPKMALM